MYPISLIDHEGLHPPGIPVQPPGQDTPDGKQFRFPGIPLGRNDRLMVGRVLFDKLLKNGEEPLYAAHITRNRGGHLMLKPVHRRLIQGGTKHLVILRLGIGFGGSNEYTGDRKGYICLRGPGYTGCGHRDDDAPIAPAACPSCGKHELVPLFHPFPGATLLRRRLQSRRSDGSIDRGSHRVATIDIAGGPVVFRAAYVGPRMDGRPEEEYFLVSKDGIEAATWEDRLAAKVDW